MNKNTKQFWLDAAADAVLQHIKEYNLEKKQIIVASGITSSGVVHLGNLREFMSVHLVAEALKKRGFEVKHIHSWDNYDRFRKVPAGIPEDFADHLGKSIADVPDPFGKEESYAAHFAKKFQSEILPLQFDVEWKHQNNKYKTGAYNEQICHALDNRGAILDILVAFQTQKYTPEQLAEKKQKYYPFSVYCEQCQKDTTKITNWNSEEKVVSYVCKCGFEGQMSLKKGEKCHGKLPWKIDWPMRWAFEQVDFEPAGEDHHSPNSSFSVGKKMVKMFDWQSPSSFTYSFVAFAGLGGKISSSKGTVATIETALSVLEPCLLRWLYVRRKPSQKFTIDFGTELIRLYEEWDRLEEKIENNTATEEEQEVYWYSTQTSIGMVEKSKTRVSFRTLTSALNIAQGDETQFLRLVNVSLGENYTMEALESECGLRIACARAWVQNFMPEQDRIFVRTEKNVAIWEEVEENVRICRDLFLKDWQNHAEDAQALQVFLYKVPKVVLNFPPELTKPTPELKTLQKAFFKALYQSLIGRNRGPRLATLFLALPKETIQELL